jgi:mono/diheme cytochrome c family protein
MAESPSRRPAATPGTAAAPRTARDLWLGYCASCHGVDGAGTPVAMVRFDATWRAQRSDSAVRAILVNGVPGTTMAPWGRHLPAAEVNALVAHVRALAEAQAATERPRPARARRDH